MSYLTDFQPLHICVLTVSDTRDSTNDTSGGYLTDALAEAGHQLHEKAIVKDDIYTIRAIVSRWIAESQVDVVITTGGTGVTGRDITPEAVAPLFDKPIEGFGEQFRLISAQHIGTSTMLSRAIAGIANGTYIFSLPGSTGACKDGWTQLIQPQLDVTTRPCNLASLIPRLRDH